MSGRIDGKVYNNVLLGLIMLLFRAAVILSRFVCSMSMTVGEKIENENTGMELDVLGETERL